MQTFRYIPSEPQNRQIPPAMAKCADMAAAGIKNPLWYGFATRLLESRLSAEISLVSLGQLSGVTHTTVCNAENAKTSPSIAIVERIACALGVSPVWLAFGHDGEEPFAERVRRSLLRVPRDPRPSDPKPCPDAFQGLPARVTQARESAGLSMRALGIAAGLTGPAIEKIEKGRSVPRLDNVEALAKVLGVSPGWLAFGIGRGPDGKKHKPSAVALA